MNVYLDIDGTLLQKDGSPAKGLHEFLEYMTANHACYWLTTHCRREGDIEHVHEYLKPKLSADTFELIRLIRPTTWNVMKTKAIDFEQDFRWFDDSVMVSERLHLQKHGCLDKLIIVNLLEKDLTAINFKLRVEARVF